MRPLLGKIFKLKGLHIAPLIDESMGCMATDRITVDGERVGYMYRERPVREEDTGWRFFAGDEDDAYMADLQRHGVYALNTIVNYDPDVLPFINPDEGSRFERNADGTLTRLPDDAQLCSFHL